MRNTVSIKILSALFSEELPGALLSTLKNIKNYIRTQIGHMNTANAFLEHVEANMAFIASSVNFKTDQPSSLENIRLDYDQFMKASAEKLEHSLLNNKNSQKELIFLDMDNFLKALDGFWSFLTSLEDIKKNGLGNPSLNNFIIGLISKVASIQEGESILFPGGWGTPNLTHVVIYQFQLKGDNLVFTVLNAGMGLEHHEKETYDTQNIFNTSLSYQFPKDKAKDKKLEDIIRTLIQMTLIHHYSSLEEGANELYQGILPLFIAIGGKIKKEHTENIDACYASEPHHACNSYQIYLLQIMRKNFQKNEDYYRFIFDCNFFSIQNYMEQFTTTTKIHTKDKQLVLNVIDNALKLLPVAQKETFKQKNQEPMILLSEEEEAQYTNKLQGHLNTIKLLKESHVDCIYDKYEEPSIMAALKNSESPQQSIAEQRLSKNEEPIALQETIGREENAGEEDAAGEKDFLHNQMILLPPSQNSLEQTHKIDQTLMNAIETGNIEAVSNRLEALNKLPSVSSIKEDYLIRALEQKQYNMVAVILQYVTFKAYDLLEYDLLEYDFKAYDFEEQWLRSWLQRYFNSQKLPWMTELKLTCYIKQRKKISLYDVAFLLDDKDALANLIFPKYHDALREKLKQAVEFDSLLQILLGDNSSKQLTCQTWSNLIACMAASDNNDSWKRDPNFLELAFQSMAKSSYQVKQQFLKTLAIPADMLASIMQEDNEERKGSTGNYLDECFRADSRDRKTQKFISAIQSYPTEPSNQLYQFLQKTGCEPLQKYFRLALQYDSLEGVQFLIDHQASIQQAFKFKHAWLPEWLLSSVKSKNLTSLPWKTSIKLDCYLRHKIHPEISAYELAFLLDETNEAAALIFPRDWKNLMNLLWTSSLGNKIRQHFNQDSWRNFFDDNTTVGSEAFNARQFLQVMKAFPEYPFYEDKIFLELCLSCMEHVASTVKHEFLHRLHNLNKDNFDQLTVINAENLRLAHYDVRRNYFFGPLKLYDSDPKRWGKEYAHFLRDCIQTVDMLLIYTLRQEKALSFDLIYLAIALKEWKITAFCLDMNGWEKLIIPLNDQNLDIFQAVVPTPLYTTLQRFKNEKLSVEEFVLYLGEEFEEGFGKARAVYDAHVDAKERFSGYIKKGEGYADAETVVEKARFTSVDIPADKAKETSFSLSTMSFFQTLQQRTPQEKLLYDQYDYYYQKC